MVTVRRDLTPETFLQITQSWLEQHEVQNNSILGLALALAKKPVYERPESHFWVVENNGVISGAAFGTPPYKLTLTRMDPASLEAFANEIRLLLPGISGAFGPKEIMPDFLKAMELPLSQFELEMSTRLYQLRKVEPLSPAPGALRPAVSSDLDFLAEWYTRFGIEIRATEEIDVKEMVNGYIQEKRLFIWEGDGARSSAGCAGFTANGARINLVYTPSEHRGKGYATSLVAALSQRLLDSGKKFCCLYTDLMNPTSNSIYKKIGYQPVSDWAGYKFK
ncbi:MAG TPA: GNAT family N-acetyltransferase [bacterium]|nr:GNAT family N-acetyltransferase [bacterium]